MARPQPCDWTRPLVGSHDQRRQCRARAARRSRHRHQRLGLRGTVSERVTDAIKRISPDSLARLAPASVKVVHVFAGLHVEAVPGSCVLPDIPEHLRVIVPGGTTYAAAPPKLDD